MHTTYSARGQGTIEYLVVLAVIVIISLVVVSLFTNMSTGSIGSIGAGATKVGTMTSAISITEAVVDFDGNIIFSLGNFSGENIAIQRVSVGEAVGSYSAVSLINGNKGLFDLNGVSAYCSCLGNFSSVTCPITIEYLNDLGVTKVVSLEVSVNCIDTIKLTNPGAVNYSNGRPARGIPEFGSCWSDSSPHTICTCEDLNKMRDHLAWDYVLGRDVDCSDTINWNAGKGFIPIGTMNDYFSGDLNGNSHIITQLYIHNPGTSGAGLFGFANGTFNDFGLIDVNISNNSSATGSVIGFSSAIIKRVHVSGKVSGWVGTGGIVGMHPDSGDMGINFVIENTYFDGNIDIVGTAPESGGIAGESTQGTISNSYFAGKLTCLADTCGGIIGFTQGTLVKNSISVGEISAGAGGIAGQLLGGTIQSSSWLYVAGGPEHCYTTNNYSGPGDIACTRVNGDIVTLYSKSVAPFSTWAGSGSWVNVSGNKWSTSDGNWSICQGSGLPWLSWENRSC